MTSSLCKKRKQDIIANCGDETKLLIELLAVMTQNEVAHDMRVKNAAIDDSQCLISLTGYLQFGWASLIRLGVLTLSCLSLHQQVTGII